MNEQQNQNRGGALENRPSKAKLLLLIGGFLLIPVISIWLCKPKDEVASLIKEENVIKEKTIAMYVQNEEGGYDTSSSTKFPTDGYVLNLEKSSCKNGGELSQDSVTKSISLSTDKADACTLYFDKESSPSEKTLAVLKVSSNGIQTTSFANAAKTAEGVFEMEDDYGTSYYYRGAVENNYVKFAGFFWRIIRINGDGSLRIIYDGTQAYANGTNNNGRIALTNVAWNASNYNDAKYVGYMYGGANGTASTSKAQAQTNQTDSNIKTKVDEWYKTNIADKGYGSAVADAIFCNDRSTPNSSYAEGFGTNQTWYGSYSRFITNQSTSQPTFKCSQKNDAFTVNDTEKGNGALTYPVGLITADEIVAAGSGKYNTTNTKYYLYKSNSYYYWSLSPCNMYPSGGAYGFYVNISGYLYGNYVNTGGAVVPVINLSAEYVSTLVGDGSMTSPYRQSGEAI